MRSRSIAVVAVATLAAPVTFLVCLSTAAARTEAPRAPAHTHSAPAAVRAPVFNSAAYPPATAGDPPATAGEGGNIGHGNEGTGNIGNGNEGNNNVGDGFEGDGNCCG